MRYEPLRPKRDKYSNAVLSSSSFSEVYDLPVTRYQAPDKTPIVASYYRLSLWQRIRFLFCGRIYVQLRGKTHAPLAVGIGEFFNLAKGK